MSASPNPVLLLALIAMIAVFILVAFFFSIIICTGIVVVLVIVYVVGVGVEMVVVPDARCFAEIEEVQSVVQTTCQQSIFMYT